MRICFVRLSALGDIVMCLPLLRTLQKSFPKAEITWIIGKPFYPLVEKIEGVSFLPLPKIQSISDWWSVKKLLEPLTFDVLLATQASLSANLLYPLISAKRKIGYDHLRSKDFHGLFVRERIPFEKKHTVEGFLQFAKAIGAGEISYESNFTIESKEEAWQKQFQFPYFIVNPCSSKKEKDWNYNYYKDVILDVQKKFGLKAIITGGSLDAPICDKIAKESDSLSLAGKTSLKELVALIKGAKFMLSPDTGPAHIASACGIPTIALFAPTASQLTGPYFSKEHVIDKHEEVLARYATEKEKKRGWNVRIYHKEAMELIQINEVQKKIEEVLL